MLLALYFSAAGTLSIDHLIDKQLSKD